ncbi:carbamoyltransferase family protein [Helicobacter sp. 'CLO3_human']|uniref:carbamoyltransferase family protein n=1 Tax=Helicobacter sp. 'CLO3_human' TaxID=2020249 RepID=UPI001F3CB246|nr:carbamoyltransferase N-terminal domain-containing protein [Helicobacter sp. 'CLO3_human']
MGFLDGGGGAQNVRLQNLKNPLQNSCQNSLDSASSNSTFPKTHASEFTTSESATSKSTTLESTPRANCVITLESIDAFVFYDKPFLKFERLLETYLTTAPFGFFSFVKAIPVWLKDKLFLKETIARELEALYIELYPHKSAKEAKAFKKSVYEKIYFCEHHISHAASAFYPSPFAESAVLCIDGVGEWSTTSIAKGYTLDSSFDCGEGVDSLAGADSSADSLAGMDSSNAKKAQIKQLEILEELHFPHSLGLLYSAFTYYTGFKVNSGEYKVMGLAPYGVPRFSELIKRELIDIKEDGSFALNMRYFSYTYGLRMTNKKFDRLFGGALRKREGELMQAHMDLAASIQAVTEEVMLKLARTALKRAQSKNLCMSGGVALNCVGNGKIYKALKDEGLLENLWVQPASGDAGSALGCALEFYYQNSSLGKNSASSMQCDKIYDFSEGTDTKSANLPKNHKNLHSHTANLGICESKTETSANAKSTSRHCEEAQLTKQSTTKNSQGFFNQIKSSHEVRHLERLTGVKGVVWGLGGGLRQSVSFFSNLSPLSPCKESSSSGIDSAKKLELSESTQMDCFAHARKTSEASFFSNDDGDTSIAQDRMHGSYLGLSYTNAEVQSALDSLGAVYERHDFNTLKNIVARALSEGKVVGWHQGRCEFGPRALGARSILGDPRNTTMQKTMNLKIKYRESFRPFAPSVLESALSEWFELDCASPYMLLVAPVKKERCFSMSEEQKALFGIEKLNVVRSEIPSVTHIDYSARIQSVHKDTNPRYYALLEEFYKLSGVPVLVNTSFNVRGEPIVCSPEDSFACFMGTEMDVLVVEDFVLYKEAQNTQNLQKYKAIKDNYELD